LVQHFNIFVDHIRCCLSQWLPTFSKARLIGKGSIKGFTKGVNGSQACLIGKQGKLPLANFKPAISGR